VPDTRQFGRFSYLHSMPSHSLPTFWMDTVQPDGPFNTPTVPRTLTHPAWCGWFFCRVPPPDSWTGVFSFSIRYQRTAHTMAGQKLHYTKTPFHRHSWLFAMNAQRHPKPRTFIQRHSNVLAPQTAARLWTAYRLATGIVRATPPRLHPVARRTRGIMPRWFIGFPGWTHGGRLPPTCLIPGHAANGWHSWRRSALRSTLPQHHPAHLLHCPRQCLV